MNKIYRYPHMCNGQSTLDLKPLHFSRREGKIQVSQSDIYLFSHLQKTSYYIDPRGEKFQGIPHPLHNFFGLYTAPLLPECLIYLHPDLTISLTVFWAMPLRAPCHPE